MKTLFITLFSVIMIYSCGQTQTRQVNIPVGSSKKLAAKEAVATFAEGCFWHSEIVFQSLAGVRDAVSGYTGGKTKNPDYESVCSGETGHAEAVEVYYDPSVISYETLVKAFFASMDPTELNRQGNDVGTQYRSAAYYRTDAEKKILEAEVKRLTDAKTFRGKIVTEIVPYTKFYPAEAYHQEYISHHPDNPYVSNVSIPDFEKFRREFKGNFK